MGASHGRNSEKALRIPPQDLLLTRPLRSGLVKISVLRLMGGRFMSIALTPRSKIVLLSVVLLDITKGICQISTD